MIDQIPQSGISCKEIIPSDASAEKSQPASGS